MSIKHETDDWKFIPAKHFTDVKGNRAVRLIVIHSAETLERSDTAENIAHYFATTNRSASAHVCIDANSIVQCVKDSDIAWAAPGANSNGLQIELAGKAAQTEEQWLDDYGRALLENAANVVAQYCLKYEIPIRHLTNKELAAGQKGIVGHYQVSEVYKKSTHTDPGKHFPWPHLLTRARNFFIERLNQSKDSG